MKKRIIFLLSHPIQYFSPLFTKMNESGDFDLTVLYCDDYGVRDKNVHPEVGEIPGWDIPLLEGYNYKFLKNNSWKPSIFNGFFGLINLEIIKVLLKERGSFLVVQGWNYLTHFIAIVGGHLFSIKICVRGDNPFNQEALKSKKLLFLKKILLGKFLFRFINYFLYVGQQNKKFYEYYGIPENKLIFTPHAVDNDRFRAEFLKYRDRKPEIRRELGLPVDKKIILFSGKYVAKKRPMDLLHAYQLLNDPDTALVFLGDGELRKEMEDYTTKYNLKDVYLIGFKNQSEVGKYFSAADIFVLPSGEGETWGLVMNEALNFGLPVIVSSIVGCAEDLAKPDDCYTVGNITELMKILSEKLKKNYKPDISFELIDNYSNDNIIEQIKKLINK